MKEKIIATLMGHGYRVYTRPFELNIVGVRSANGTPNVFNDCITVMFKDEKGSWQFHCYAATTDPGMYWLQNPLNVEGTAILKAGQYIGSHCIGLHRQQYTALVQRAPVTVFRDANRNNTIDMNGKKDTGLFGINIHRANQSGTTKAVDKFSAGCQVFANANDFNAFMSICEKHKTLYGNSFTYTLLNDDDLMSMAA